MDKRTLAGLSEAYLDQQVLGTAHEAGWKAYHISDSRRVVVGDTGYPDWTFARSGQVIFAENKTETGTLSSEQTSWLLSLGWLGPDLQWAQLPGNTRRVYVFRPSDWDERRIKAVFEGVPNASQAD